MKIHVSSVHERKKTFKCDICDYSFSQKSHLKIHVASVHEGKSCYLIVGYEKEFDPIVATARP